MSSLTSSRTLDFKDFKAKGSMTEFMLLAVLTSYNMQMSVEGV